MNPKNWLWMVLALSTSWNVASWCRADDEAKQDQPKPERKEATPPAQNFRPLDDAPRGAVNSPGEETRPTDARPRTPDQGRQELQRRIAELRQRVEELRDAGKEEEAAALQREIERLVQRPQGEGRAATEMIRRRAEELRRSGRPDEAAELERQAEEMVRRGRASPGFGDRPGPRGLEGFRPLPEGREPSEPDRRIEHLRQAAENLEAAGLRDLADQLRRQAEEMTARRGPPPEARAELEELRNHVRQLSERIERLEEMIRRLVQREQGNEESANPPQLNRRERKESDEQEVEKKARE